MGNRDEWPEWDRRRVATTYTPYRVRDAAGDVLRQVFGIPVAIVLVTFAIAGAVLWRMAPYVFGGLIAIVIAKGLGIL